MNKRYIKILLIVSAVYFLFQSNWVFWTEIPKVNCYWLPWCADSDAANPGRPWTRFTWIPYISNIIWTTIQYIAVLSVVVVMISWVMYMLSGWEDEKVKKAKKWMIWSLVGVFLSISAWSIINILNTFRLG